MKREAKEHMYQILRSTNLVSVYRRPVGSRKLLPTEYFDGTSQNIASYLFRNADAKDITIFNSDDQMILQYSEGQIKDRVNYKLKRSVSWYLTRMKHGSILPAIFDSCTLSELKKDARSTKEVTCYFKREDSDEYVRWKVELPLVVIDRFKSIEPIREKEAVTLLSQLPEFEPWNNPVICLLEEENDGFAMYTTVCSQGFFYDYHGDGESVVASLKYLLEDIVEDDIITEIWLEDMNPEMQNRLARIFGCQAFKDGPIFSFHAPNCYGGLCL